MSRSTAAELPERQDHGPADARVFVLESNQQWFQSTRVTNLSEGFRSAAAREPIVVVQHRRDQRIEGRSVGHLTEGLGRGRTSISIHVSQLGQQRLDGAATLVHQINSMAIDG
jgi:hypothetical protein